MVRGKPESNVLVVDLDGTLVKTDVFVEALVQLCVRHSLSLPRLFLWLLRGKAITKCRVAQLVDMDVSTLPYNSELLDFLSEQRAAGRKIWLATGAHRKYAESVAAHLGLFDRVLATDEACNLTGKSKLERLVGELGTRAFDYVGNDAKDLCIWSQARKAYLAGASRSVARNAARTATVVREFTASSRTVATLLRAVRAYQWIKNALVFAPLLLAHKVDDLELVASCSIAFVAFSMVASSAYVLNDLADVPFDRHHPRKRLRPFASGALSARAGFILAAILLVGASAVSLLLPKTFWLVLATYFIGTIAYSVKLKQHAMVDVMVLAGLYTLRVLGGLAVMQAAPTFWLLAFSVFLFLSLALLKRYGELRVMSDAGVEQPRGRGYEVGDRTILAAAGMASGYLAALVLALYVNSPEILRLYRRPEVIWLLCALLLYWISRMWMITHRGDMHDDPIVFAAADGPSVLIGGLSVLIIVVAML